jgi:hypothetical protein
MNKWKSYAAAALLVAATVFGTTGPAHAAGITHFTGACNGQSPSTGTAHAKITGCTWDYYYFAADRTYEYNVTYTLTDPITDTYCAHGDVVWRWAGAPKSEKHTECTTGGSLTVHWGNTFATGGLTDWNVETYYASGTAVYIHLFG